MDHTAAVNFIRLLDRCYHQALDPDQHIHHLSNLHKSAYILREQAEILSQTDEGLDYLQKNECQRKLSFLYQTLGISDNRTTSHPASFTQAENNARLKYQNQALEQQRRILFQKTKPFENDSEEILPENPADSMKRVHERKLPKQEHKLQQKHPESKQERLEHNVLRKRLQNPKKPDFNSDAAVTPGSIDEERARHEEISGMLINLSQSLIHRAKDIGKHVRNDNKILNNVEGQSRTAVEEIGDQHKHLKRQQRESGWCAFGTYFLLILVAISFLITYFMVKMFPKAN